MERGYLSRKGGPRELRRAGEGVDFLFTKFVSAAQLFFWNLATAPAKRQALKAWRALRAPPKCSGSTLKTRADFIHDDALLGRPTLVADQRLLARAVEGRVLLVTGAAGSVGSELCGTISGLRPAKLVMLDVSEAGLFALRRELSAATFPVVAVLGSVTDGDLLREVMRRHGVTVVYHCAAYKHVAMVETNCLEAVRNNVLGTWALCEAARDCGVATFVHVSSDKAVSPAGVMGATKLWAERVVGHFGAAAGEAKADRVFASVRLSNVLGSSGSVVPIFREQIAAGQPLTLNHPDMTRHFMTAREAAETILQAGVLAGLGDVLVPELGPPLRIVELAERLAARQGLTLRTRDRRDGDVELAIVGMAAGEKLHERQVEQGCHLAETTHRHIRRVERDDPVPGVRDSLQRLRALIAARDEAGVRRFLFEGIA